MTSVPLGLTTLLAEAPLPTAALLAAVDQRPLQTYVARRGRVPGAVIERCFVPGALPRLDVAQLLVDRRLPARVVRHVLRTAGERRPSVLAALARHNVPAARDRRGLLACGDVAIDEAILANPDWPVEEQAEVVCRADGGAALRWLAQLDPAVPVSLDDLLDREGRTRLDADPVTALQALLRRPWLSGVPLELAGPGLRSAIATVTADDRTLYRLLGRAQRLAGAGRTGEAARLVEAVACNPSAPLAVQRRCRRLARRLHCHYLDGWLPNAAVNGPLWDTDASGQRRAIARIEALAHVRHRTVWNAGLLAVNPQLVPDVRERIVAYLDDHLAAVDGEPGTAEVLADRLQVDETTRQHWVERCWTGLIGPCGYDPGSPAVPAEGRLRRRLDELHLDDCAEPQHGRTVARELRATFGDDVEAWSLAFLLLREGWDAPLADLPPVIAALTQGTVAA
jgi:hypothetical protein